MTQHLILTERPGTYIEVVSTAERSGILVADDGIVRGAYFNRSDAPALALAILEAAAPEIPITPSSCAYFEAINWLQTIIARREKEAATAIAQAKEAEALASRNKRRDELAREFDDSCDASFAIYDDAPTTTRRAIDRIIELEAEAAK